MFKTDNKSVGNSLVVHGEMILFLHDFDCIEIFAFLVDRT